MLLINPTTQSVHFHATPSPSLTVEPLGTMFDPVTGAMLDGIYIIDVPDGHPRFLEYVKMEMLAKFFPKGDVELPIYDVKKVEFYTWKPEKAVVAPPVKKKKAPAPVVEEVVEEEEEVVEEEVEEEEVVEVKPRVKKKKKSSESKPSVKKGKKKKST